MGLMGLMIKLYQAIFYHFYQNHTTSNKTLIFDQFDWSSESLLLFVHRIKFCYELMGSFQLEGTSEAPSHPLISPAYRRPLEVSVTEVM